jgi:preprotein translocase subunit SecG
MDNLMKLMNLLAPAKDAATYATYRTVSIVFIIAMFVAAVAAIVLVLIQPGNSEGIDALGGSSETFFGKNKGKSTEATLKKWTIVCLVVLSVLAIVFYILQYDGIWG